MCVLSTHYHALARVLVHIPVAPAPATVVVLDTGLRAHVDHQLWTGKRVARTILLLPGLTSATSLTGSPAAKSPTVYYLYLAV